MGVICPLVSVPDDPREFGRRVAAARAYTGKSQAEFGADVLDGLSDKTVAGIEQGGGAANRRRDERTRIAEMIVRQGRVPPEILGLSEPPTDAELDELRRSVGALVTLVTVPELRPAARRLLENELAVARQWSTSTPHSEEPGTGVANG